MNNNAASKRPVGPVRQHSLPQPPRHQQQIRRQRSTDDEHHQQAYSTSSVGFRNRVPGNSSYRQSPTLDPPRVRVAWSEQSVKPKSEGGVEIVARQIQTGKLNRSTAGRDNKSIADKCPLRDKARILYSKQELAERLKLAWRQREENKANIDIFLAHNTVEDRCDSVMSTETNLTVQLTPKLHKKDQQLDRSQAQNEKSNNETNYAKQKRAESKSNEGHNFQAWLPSNICKKSTTISDERQLTDYHVAKSDEREERIEALDEEAKGNRTTNKKSSININCHNWNPPAAMDNTNDTRDENESKSLLPALVKESDYSKARVKRANYQNSLNKAFASQIIDKSSTSKVSSRNDNTIRESARFRRTSSAPPQQRAQVNITIEPTAIPLCMTNPEPERWIMSVNESSQSVVKSTIDTNRPIKSAPTVKRRSKANKRRSLSVAYSKDGEDDTVLGGSRGTTKNVKAGRSTLASKSTDVVTMVSLVSSADSDSEMDEISSRDDKLISELRNKLPTTPIIKSSNGLSGGIRKPFKSVSFQQDSVEREEDSSLHADAAVREDARTSLRTRFFALNKSSVIRNAIGLGSTSPELSPLPTPWRAETLVPVHVEAILGPAEVTLTDREKRCLAVPIVDIRDKKRKLLRCRSAVAAPRTTIAEKQLSGISQSCLQTELRLPQMISRASLVLQESNSAKGITNPSISASGANVEEKKKSPTQSYCQTPKEKECWHLYQRMCDKGVFVSFDTVLRGMLTPTEYRLRQKEISQNC